MPAILSRQQAGMSQPKIQRESRALELPPPGSARLSWALDITT